MNISTLSPSLSLHEVSVPADGMDYHQPLKEFTRQQTCRLKVYTKTAPSMSHSVVPFLVPNNLNGVPKTTSSIQPLIWVYPKAFLSREKFDLEPTLESLRVLLSTLEDCSHHLNQGPPKQFLSSSWHEWLVLLRAAHVLYDSLHTSLQALKMNEEDFPMEDDTVMYDEEGELADDEHYAPSEVETDSLGSHEESFGQWTLKWTRLQSSLRRVQLSSLKQNIALFQRFMFDLQTDYNKATVLAYTSKNSKEKLFPFSVWRVLTTQSVLSVYELQPKEPVLPSLSIELLPKKGKKSSKASDNQLFSIPSTNLASFVAFQTGLAKEFILRMLCDYQHLHHPQNASGDRYWATVYAHNLLTKAKEFLVSEKINISKLPEKFPAMAEMQTRFAELMLHLHQQFFAHKLGHKCVFNFQRTFLFFTNKLIRVPAHDFSHTFSAWLKRLPTELAIFLVRFGRLLVRVFRFTAFVNHIQTNPHSTVYKQPLALCSPLTWDDSPGRQYYRSLEDFLVDYLPTLYSCVDKNYARMFERLYAKGESYVRFYCDDQADNRHGFLIDRLPAFNPFRDLDYVQSAARDSLLNAMLEGTGSMYINGLQVCSWDTPNELLDNYQSEFLRAQQDRFAGKPYVRLESVYEHLSTSLIESELKGIFSPDCSGSSLDPAISDSILSLIATRQANQLKKWEKDCMSVVRNWKALLEQFEIFSKLLRPESFRRYERELVNVQVYLEHHYQCLPYEISSTSKLLDLDSQTTVSEAAHLIAKTWLLNDGLLDCYDLCHRKFRKKAFRFSREPSIYGFQEFIQNHFKTKVTYTRSETTEAHLPNPFRQIDSITSVEVGSEIPPQQTKDLIYFMQRCRLIKSCTESRLLKSIQREHESYRYAVDGYRAYRLKILLADRSLMTEEELESERQWEECMQKRSLVAKAAALSRVFANRNELLKDIINRPNPSMEEEDEPMPTAREEREWFTNAKQQVITEAIERDDPRIFTIRIRLSQTREETMALLDLYKNHKPTRAQIRRLPPNAFTELMEVLDLLKPHYQNMPQYIPSTHLNQ